MKLAYLDTSLVVALAFDEPQASALARRLGDLEQVFSSNLLEAEFTAALQRERIDYPVETYLQSISWVLPDRPLSPEIERVAKSDYVGGADLWHLACALYLAPEPGSLGFLTLDRQQRAVAGQLGFQI